MKIIGTKIGLTLLLSLPLLIAGCEEHQTVSDTRSSEPSAASQTVQQEAANRTTKMRELAWNSISAASQETVKIDWKQAEVAEIRGDQVPFPLMDSMAEQEEIPDRLVQVTFPTTQDMMLGEIVVYLDSTSGEKIGLAPRK
ncbi:hypothetical protein CDO73_17580 [Saccharibacillus sp. O23]|uniref:hypothetical protein n=1 Tax=Saccharibacillus sp. O23 TaxID=2009338 RepID=UPI000B4E53A6|nr:hypothetical protein [Saccharibacillus sp. O23]OWR28709.1 hypothetical protein CDO73_17580 [Saccharibacillus sp. O23]